ncbi:MAG: hypothetical protein ACQGVK_02075 [Myxococcota bacterium]
MPRTPPCPPVRRRAALLLATLGLACLTGCAYRQVAHLDYGVRRGIDVPAAPPDRAQVVFWVSAMNPALELAIYDADEQLGILRYATWFAVSVVPGDHRFAVVGPKSADFTVGSLEAGKTYMLEAQLIFDDRFRLQPVTPKMRRYGGPITNLMKGCYPVAPNALTAAENARLDERRRAILERYSEKWLTRPESDRRRLGPEHAIDGPVTALLDDAS